VVSRGADELGINPNALTVDVPNSKTASAGKAVEALEQYRGELLPLFVSDAPESIRGSNVSAPRQIGASRRRRCPRSRSQETTTRGRCRRRPHGRAARIRSSLMTNRSCGGCSISLVQLVIWRGPCAPDDEFAERLRANTTIEQGMRHARW